MSKKVTIEDMKKAFDIKENSTLCFYNDDGNPIFEVFNFNCIYHPFHIRAPSTLSGVLLLITTTIT